MPAFAGMTKDLDPDRTLALSYVSYRRRPALAALWKLDAALGAVLTQGREPMLSRIKLAWWRDALEALDRAPPPAEPVLQAVAAHALTVGVTGAELAPMEDAWAVLLSPGPLTSEELATYAAGRGGLLFAASARLLGRTAVFRLGEAWALADLARHSANGADADAAMAALAGLPPPTRLAKALRPLGMLDSLARRDAEEGRPRWEPQGSPGRMLRMLRHRLTGF